jgi:hypothetical protein
VVFEPYRKDAKAIGLKAPMLSAQSSRFRGALSGCGPIPWCVRGEAH